MVNFKILSAVGQDLMGLVQPAPVVPREDQHTIAGKISSCPDCELTREEIENSSSPTPTARNRICKGCSVNTDRSQTARLPCNLGSSFLLRYTDPVIGPMDIMLRYCIPHHQYCGDGTIFMGDPSERSWWWSVGGKQMLEPHSGLMGKLPLDIKNVERPTEGVLINKYPKFFQHYPHNIIELPIEPMLKVSLEFTDSLEGKLWTEFFIRVGNAVGQKVCNIPNLTKPGNVAQALRAHMEPNLPKVIEHYFPRNIVKGATKLDFLTKMQPHVPKMAQSYDIEPDFCKQELWAAEKLALPGPIPSPEPEPA